MRMASWIDRERFGWVARWVPWVLLVGLALWFRVTSLGALPEPSGDEVFYSIQTYRLVTGDPVSLRTPTGNPSNPAILAVLAPLLSLFGPRFWIARAPTAIAGVLAVALTFVWCRRWCDRPTALIAASVMALTPMAISVSRTGTESGVTPLFALLALHQAFLGRRFGLLVSYLACLVMHPTNLFLAPIMASVYLGRTLPRVERSRWWRVGVEVSAASGVILAVLGLIALKRPGSAALYNSPMYRPPDWPTFLISYPRYLLGQPLYRGRPILRPWIQRFDWLFWGTVAMLAAAGIPGLVRRRRWDCLALIGSLGFSLYAFSRMGGAAVLSSDFHRYGGFLVAPSALALAFLAREVLYTQGDEAVPARARWLPVTIALVLAAGALVTFKTRFFDFCNSSGRESIWTLQADDTGPLERAYLRIAADIGREKAAGEGNTRVRGVIAENWWVGRPIEFLALGRPDLKVVLYDQLRGQTPADRVTDFLRRRAEAGDYFVEDTRMRAVLSADLRLVVPPERIEGFDLGALCWPKTERLHPASPRIADGATAGPSHIRQ